MKLFLTAVSFFLFCSGYSQNPINEAIKSYGVLNVNYTDYFSNGQLRLSYVVKDGNLEGEYAEYYKNGKTRGLSYFEHGHFNGTNKTFDEQGNIFVEEKYAHDTLLFYRETCYYKNGQLKTLHELTFDKDSLKISPFIKVQTYDHSVNYDVNLTMQNMKSHGKYIEYYNSGKIEEVDTLVNNLMEGIVRMYYENGQVSFEGTYHEAKENGTLIYYSKSGEIEKTEEWKDGKLITTNKSKKK